MKTIIATAAALLISTSVFAAGSWTDVGNDDQYGGVYFDSTASSNHAVQPGIGDAYGSILMDTGPGDVTGEPQPGHSDNYGSILLDL